MKSLDKIEIIAFSSQHKDALRKLNYEWLEKYFYVEDKDRMMLSDPQKYIIDAGGFVFYAKQGDEIVGSAALMIKNDKEYELGKMAVTQKCQGLGIGRKLLEHCLSFAQKREIDALFLITDSKLQPAIRLYQKYGFREVEFESGLYERGDVKMEIKL